MVTPPTLPPEAYEALELDLVDTIDNAVDPNTRLLRDTRLDDREFPEFRNYMEFMTDKNGLNLKPFARQLIIPTMLMGEWCPPCSHKRARRRDLKKVWTWDDIKVKDTIDEVKDRIQFMHYGTCPKCGETKKSLFKQKLLQPYGELAALIGQRVGKTLMLGVPILIYQHHRMLKLPKPYAVYELNPTPLVSTMVAQTFQNAYDQLFNPYKTYVDECKWFCVAAGTKVTMSNGSTKDVKDIVVGEDVKTLEGSSDVIQKFDNGVKDCKQVTLANGNSLVATDEHKVRVLNEEGTELVWKLVKDLTTKDYVVVES